MTRWAHVRAALVGFHLVAISLSAFPSPEGGMNKKAWAEPTVQAEFAAWSARLGVPPDEFEANLWDFAQVYQRGYDRLLTPIRPYEALVGSEQSWKMFIAPHRFPTRLQISARAGSGEWDTLFEEGDPVATWNAPTLRLERLRASIFRWGWASFQSAWAHACTAFARRAFADFPDYTQVRCRFWKAASPSPAEAMSGHPNPGKWVFARLVDRGPDGLPLTGVAAGTTPALGAAPAPPGAGDAAVPAEAP